MRTRASRNRHHRLRIVSQAVIPRPLRDHPGKCPREEVSRGITPGTKLSERKVEIAMRPYPDVIQLTLQMDVIVAAGYDANKGYYFCQEAFSHCPAIIEDKPSKRTSFVFST